MKLLSVCFCALAAFASAHAASDAEAVMELARAAVGGDAWANVRALHIRSTVVTGGVKGERDAWEDVQSGRFMNSLKLPTEAQAEGYDGVSFWTQARGGYFYVVGDDDARQGAVDHAFQTARAFWITNRFNGTITLTGQRQEEGRAYQIIEATPQGGRPFNIWIDAETHLIDRFEEQGGEDLLITRFSDYRVVDKTGVKLPFTIRTGNGEAKWDEVASVMRVEANPSIPDDQFRMPANPPPDFQFAGGESSATVPFSIDGNKLLFDIKINGQGPFPAELDSGGNYIVQRALAGKLQLTEQGVLQEGGGGEGFVAASRATVETVQIGNLTLRQQAYKIVDFDEDAPNRTLLGLQVLQRLVVRIDFDRSEITFTRPEAFRYEGSGQIVPFIFQDNQPEVRGEVDGVAGVFTIDTGDNGSLLLIAPFVNRHNFVEHYGAVIPYGGSAMGGATHGLLARAHGLTLFGVNGNGAVHASELVTRLSQQKAGFDANRYVSGNVGIGVLRQFNLIFDYSRQQIIFEPNENFGARDVFNRTGLHLDVNGARWTVRSVDPGSPAAEAGYKPKDVIVSVNGKGPDELPPDELQALFKANVGVKIAVASTSGDGVKKNVLTLRDIL